MKRCPTCDKTFDDNMRFCQADGTPLADDAPVDPYKTIIGGPGGFGAGSASSHSDDVLDLPSSVDPAKTMYSSEEEIRAEMSARDEQVIDIPPLVDPEPPRFSEPGPPPSPFSNDLGGRSAPIPSPFDEPKSSTYDPPTYNPFDQPSGGPLAQSDWNPPPAPDAGWQSQPVGQNTPFEPPAVGTAGQNQTLAIISLVTGVMSIFCCGWIIPGVAAVVLGLIAKGKADSDPANFGGRGLALGGIITGAISLVLGIIVIILYLFTGVLSGIANL